MLRRIHLPLSGRRLRGAVQADVTRGLGFSELVSAFRPGRQSHASNRKSRLLRRREGARRRSGGRPRAGRIARLRRTGARMGAGSRLGCRRLARARLAVGPPGTGETLLARALARTLDMPIVAASCAAWITARDGNLGDVIQAAQTAFDAARAQRPSVPLIDELDGIPDRRRLTSRGRDWWQPVLTFLLTLLNGVATPRHRGDQFSAESRPCPDKKRTLRPDHHARAAGGRGAGACAARSSRRRASGRRYRRISGEPPSTRRTPSSRRSRPVE